MQVIRTIIWVLILFGVLLFSFFNWNPVEVTMMAKRLRQRLVQNMLEDSDTMDGRLPSPRR